MPRTQLILLGCLPLPDKIAAGSFRSSQESQNPTLPSHTLAQWPRLGTRARLINFWLKHHSSNWWRPRTSGTLTKWRRW